MATGFSFSFPVRDNSQFENKLLNGLRQFYDNQKLVDVTFKVHNPTVLIPAHRLVLTVASNYFENLFNSEQGVTPLIEIKDIPSDTFERLISSCYTGRTVVNHDNVAEMLKAARTLQLDDAVANCLDYIFENISGYTLEQVYTLEREADCEHLRQKIQEYEIQNFREIKGSAEFLNFDYEKLKRIVENEDLNVSTEEDVFAAIKRWYDHDTVSRERHLPELIGCLRLLQFDANFIMTNIHPLPGCELLAFQTLLWVSQPLARAKISLRFTEPRRSLRRNLEILTSHLAVQIGDGSEAKCILRYNKTDDKWLKYTDINTQGISDYEVNLYGDNLILIGGQRNKIPVNVVYIWNFQSKIWMPLPTMTCPRIYHSVAILDGKIYAIGGKHSNIILYSVEVYSPPGGWSLVRNMNTPRRGAAAVVLNGKIFVMGGCNGNSQLNTVERYDPTTNAWTSCANMNDSCIFPGAAVHKGFIYVVGKQVAERYDPQRDEWTKICSFPYNAIHLACSSINNQLWVIGGWWGISKAYIYNEERDRWVERACLPKGGEYSCFTVPAALLSFE